MNHSESRFCQAHAERAVRIRREREYAALDERSNARISAMLAEGQLIDEVLAPLLLSYADKLEYVANNSDLIKSDDGHEAIHLVWAEKQVICIHRLLSKEFRKEFHAQWLGVWTETIGEQTKDLITSSFKEKIKFREQLRHEVGINSEIQFAASPTMGAPAFIMQ